MIDADALAVDEAAAEICRGQHDAEADAGHRAAGAPRAAAAHHERSGVEPERQRVERGVREARAAGLAIRVLPVGDPGERGADRADDADEDRVVGAAAGGGLPRPAAAAGVEGVEDERGCPGPDGHVGEHGVQRVPEPRAVQEVLHRLPGGAAGLERGLNRPLQSVLEWREPLLPFDHLRRALGEPGQPRIAHDVLLDRKTCGPKRAEVIQKYGNVNVCPPFTRAGVGFPCCESVFEVEEHREFAVLLFERLRQVDRLSVAMQHIDRFLIHIWHVNGGRLLKLENRNTGIDEFL